MIKIPENGVIESSKSFTWVEDGIIYIASKDKSYMDLEGARELTVAFKKLVSKPLPLLVDLNTSAGQSAESRKYFVSDPTHVSFITALVLLVNNPVAKVIANVYLGINKSPVPTRIFSSLEEGVNWLEQFK